MPKPKDPNALHGHSKFTKARGQAALEILKRKASRTAAASKAGVARQTLTNWITDGCEAGSGPLYEFARQALAIEADNESAAAEAFHADNPGGWLRTRHRSDWSERTEYTGADGGPIKQEFGLIDPDENPPETNGDQPARKAVIDSLKATRG